MFQLGLKLYSTDISYRDEVSRLYALGLFSYIELGVIPNTFDDKVLLWKEINVPYVIHAPHYGAGMNLGQRAALADNMRYAEETRRYADFLRAETIIFHGGTDGDIEETIFQLKQIRDARIVIENKPRVSLFRELICIGHTPEEIHHIKTEACVGFCLDVGHAFCAANALMKDRYEWLSQFLALQPKIFHLSDGDVNGVFDQHRHFGFGNFEIKTILALFPERTHITIETQKDSKSNLLDFENDVYFLRKHSLVREG